MTEPGERIAVLESRAGTTEDRLERIERKVDDLLKAANMMQGGWLVSMKIGGFIVLAIGAIGYLVDHLRMWLTGH